MYCSKCGSALSNKEAKFCHECGSGLNESVTSRKRPLALPDTQASTSSSCTAVSFEEFREKKQKERTSWFKRKKGTSEGKSEKKSTEVIIQIGLMKLRDGNLKIVRGSTLPLKVLPRIESNELLKKSVEKMLKFNKDIRGSSDHFTLVYPDRTEVKFLPGGTELFTLQRYKEELGKAYARITLYLCKTGEYFDAYFSESIKCLEESDEVEDNLTFQQLTETEDVDLGNSVKTTNCFTENSESTGSTSTSTSNIGILGVPVGNVPAITLGTAGSTSTTGSISNIGIPGCDPVEDVPIITLGTTHEIQPPIMIEDTTNYPVKNVLVHRVMIKEDMIRLFKDSDIFIYNVDVRFIGDDGNEEAGVGIGVFRDALASFWSQFFNSLSIGAQEKVPAIRHDFQKAEWEAIGRILVYGYVREGYFPLPLSRGFLASCLFGEEAISQEYLLASFRLYISEDEREALDKCLSEEWMSDDEDVLDFLSNYQCFRNPQKENILQIVCELAHKELIQKPRYIVHCWAPIVRVLLMYSDFTTLNGVESVYDAKRPTAKKVVKLIVAQPSSAAERQCLDYLKKYIRSLQGVSLSLFLKFVTGSDVMSCKTIDVSFTDLDGAARRPIIHTCGPAVELPSTYQSYNELSEEFSELLQQKDSWKFNIV